MEQKLGSSPGFVQARLEKELSENSGDIDHVATRTIRRARQQRSTSPQQSISATPARISKKSKVSRMSDKGSIMSENPSPSPMTTTGPLKFSPATLEANSEAIWNMMMGLGKDRDKQAQWRSVFGTNLPVTTTNNYHGDGIKAGKPVEDAIKHICAKIGEFTHKSPPTARWYAASITSIQQFISFGMHGKRASNVRTLWEKLILFTDLHTKTSFSECVTQYLDQFAPDHLIPQDTMDALAAYVLYGIILTQRRSKNVGDTRNLHRMLQRSIANTTTLIGCTNGRELITSLHMMSLVLGAVIEPDDTNPSVLMLTISYADFYFREALRQLFQLLTPPHGFEAFRTTLLSHKLLSLDDKRDIYQSVSFIEYANHMQELSGIQIAHPHSEPYQPALAALSEVQAIQEAPRHHRQSNPSRRDNSRQGRQRHDTRRQRSPGRQFRSPSPSNYREQRREHRPQSPSPSNYREQRREHRPQSPRREQHRDSYAHSYNSRNNNRSYRD